jgi:cytochrome c553
VLDIVTAPGSGRKLPWVWQQTNGTFGGSFREFGNHGGAAAASQPRPAYYGQMSMKLKYALLILTMLTAAAVHGDPLVEGSAEAGQAKSVTCAACHGPGGNSVNPAWPSLAGQNAPYVLKQLEAFKSGSRTDPLMTAQAMSLSEQDMRDLAVYYASQAAAPKAVAAPDTVNKGEALYQGGNAGSNVAACLACHGPTGRGNPAAAYPMLKGQYATYTATQLRNYANGQRKSDGPTRVMRDIAARLEEDDIVAVASYIQGLK